MKSDYLMHHGIKGMRWGVRRFQNKDGSLTSAGRSRYGDGRAENGGHFSPTKNRGSKTSKGGRLTARDRREIAELDEVERAERRSDNQPANFRPASKATINYMKGLEKEARKGGRLTARDRREIAELDEVERAERRSDNQPANFRPASKATINYMKGLEKEARKGDRLNSKKKRELTPEEKQARKEKLIKGAKTAAAVLGTTAAVAGAAYLLDKHVEKRRSAEASRIAAKNQAFNNWRNQGVNLMRYGSTIAPNGTSDHTSVTFTGSRARTAATNQYNIPRIIPGGTSAENRHLSSGHANSSNAWTGRAANYRAQSASVRAARNSSRASDHGAGSSLNSTNTRSSMKYGSAVTSRMNRGVTATRSNDSVQRANARAAANTERARAALEEHMRRTGSRRR